MIKFFFDFFQINDFICWYIGFSEVEQVEMLGVLGVFSLDELIQIMLFVVI